MTFVDIVLYVHIEIQCCVARCGRFTLQGGVTVRQVHVASDSLRPDWLVNIFVLYIDTYILADVIACHCSTFVVTAVKN